MDEGVVCVKKEGGGVCGINGGGWRMMPFDR